MSGDLKAGFKCIGKSPIQLCLVKPKCVDECCTKSLNVTETVSFQCCVQEILLNTLRIDCGNP